MLIKILLQYSESGSAILLSIAKRLVFCLKKTTLYRVRIVSVTCKNFDTASNKH